MYPTVYYSTCGSRLTTYLFYNAHTLHCVQVVPLMRHGEDTEVTDVNKMQYLNLVAEHRLAKQTREQMESFLKGQLE